MAARLKYNPQSNRWEQSPSSISGTDNPPPDFNPVPGATYVDTVTGEKKQFLGVGSPDRVVSGKPTATTTAPKAPTTTVPKPSTTTTPKSPTTTTPKSPTTTTPKSPTTTTPKTTTTTVPTTVKPGENQNRRPTSVVPPVVPPRESAPYNPNIAKPADTTKLISDAVANALKDGDNSGLLSLLLGSSSSGSGSGKATGPSESQLRQQRIGAAKKAGGQAVKMGQQYYGQQQQQANTSIDAATEELLKNLGQPTAYTNLPLVNIPPALQGLQQNLLAYGGTGEQAAGQQAEDQQAGDMYTALARRGAEQLGQAESGYFEALKRAATGAQAAGKQGVATNTADFQNQILMANIRALLNAAQ